MYARLASYLAALSEISLDDVFSIERNHTGKNAVHAVSSWDLSEQAMRQYERVYEMHQLDAEERRQLEIVSMTYCIQNDDGRRVIILLEPLGRRAYPLWWDPRHQVSGTVRKERGPRHCGDPACFHPPER